MTEREFEKEWSEKINSGLLKIFPDDYIHNQEKKELKMPGVSLTLGSELFGIYEIIDSQGNQYFQFDDYKKIKYILYANRNKSNIIYMPADESVIPSIVDEYESFLDVLLKRINSEFKKEFPESRNALTASNGIFNTLNLQRY